MTKKIASGIVAIMIAMTFAIFSTHTASAGGHKKIQAKRNVLSGNIIIMNGIMAPKKSYTKSRPTASSGGSKKAPIKRNVLSGGVSGVIGPNNKMAPKKSYTKSRPTASSGGQKKAPIKRNGLSTGIVVFPGIKATRK